MNILISINEFGRGGAERIASYILEYLSNMYAKNKYYLHLLEEQKIAYPIPKKIDFFLTGKETNSNSIKLFRIPRQAFQLKNIIKKNKINIVLSLLNRANYVNIISKILGGKHRCLISERNTASLVYSSSGLVDIINQFLIRKLYPYSDKIIAISGGVKTDLIKNFNIPEKKISVIYNPIDVDTIINKSMEKIEHKWLDDQSINTIISVARLEKQKNHALLIKAFHKVYALLPQTRLLILGEGSERKKLQQLINNLNLDNRIELAGAKDNPFSFLAKAELLVLSSDFEGFGNVILEAMTCHCPVISTDCQSGPGEIITHNKDGLLVPVGDVDTMSNAIMSLLEDKSLRESLAMHAQTRVLDFRLESIVQQYYRAIL